MAKYLYSENRPSSTTHYLEIPLGGGSPSPGMTGVFVPKNYRPSGDVDLILYLHGHRSGATIDSYWSRGYSYPFHFREWLNESDKNAVLVAPSLGPTSEAGSLMDAGGGDDYLDEVREVLKSHGPHTSTPDVGNIVLAAHSGGGVPMRFLARKGFKKYHDNVKECWGFDCTYNSDDASNWTDWSSAGGSPSGKDMRDWAATNHNDFLYIYYIENSGTAAQAEEIRRLAAAANLGNVTVKASETSDHYKVPGRYFFQRLQGSWRALSTRD
jgi:hypothetical protein